MFLLSHLFLFDMFHSQRAKTPELVPESAEPMRTGVPKSVEAAEKALSIWNRIKDYLADPRMGPTLLLGALLSAGNVWWTRSRSTRQPVPTNQQSSDQSDNNVTMKWFSIAIRVYIYISQLQRKTLIKKDWWLFTGGGGGEEEERERERRTKEEHKRWKSSCFHHW